MDHSSDVIQFSEESNQEEIEEYIFQWQEKIFNKLEIKKHRDPIFRKKAYEKYHNISIKESNQKKKYPQKLFTYVDVDNYTIGTSHSKTSVKKSSSMQKTKNFGNTPKTKIIDYYPSHDRKNEHNEKYIQKMFIMIDLGLNNE